MSLVRANRAVRNLGLGTGRLARPPTVLEEPDVRPRPDLCATPLGLTDKGVLFHGAISADGSTLYFVSDAQTDRVWGYSWTGLASTLGLVTFSFSGQIEDLTCDEGDRLFWLEAQAGDILVYRFDISDDDYLELADDGNGGNNLVYHPDTGLLYFLDSAGFHSIDPDTPGTTLITAGLIDADVEPRTFVAVPGGIWARADGQTIIFIELDGTTATHTTTGVSSLLSIPAPRPDGTAVFLRSDDGFDPDEPWLGYQIDQAMTVTRHVCLDPLNDDWTVVYQSPDASYVGIESSGQEWALDA